MSDRETSEEIDAAAAHWAVRVDSSPLGSKEQASLDQWLAGDARRLGAYARARAVFAHSKRAKALGPDFDPNAYLAANRGAIGGASGVSRAAGARTPAMDRRVLLLRGGGALAAGVATAMFTFTGQVAARTYSTGRGEIRLVPLPDGSTMTLNTSTTARVEFVEAKRRVELVDGEALFDIAHNAASPCIVRAGDSMIQAVGSSFTVSRLRNKPVQVLVRQGFVDIGVAKRQQTLDRVSANSSAVIAPTEQVDITPLAPAEVTRQLAWREGMLSFEDQPLRDAANEFARYSGTRIAFSDPGIGDETVTGLFAANNPVGFANSVALSLGLRADFAAETVTLRRVQ